jgi:hypothetical protein
MNQIFNMIFRRLLGALMRRFMRGGAQAARTKRRARPPR